jgi:hypothetical protein
VVAAEQAEDRLRSVCTQAGRVGGQPTRMRG